MQAHIVIGVGYGDEGKGMTVNHLVQKLDSSIVVRFSGGQQIGHTVVNGGIKHIFSNFGSGSLEGAPTYFTEHCTMYPVTYERERLVLEDKGVGEPLVYYHPKCMVTTPFDRYANRIDATQVSHGTCGLGVGKTMNRNLNSPVKLYAIDLLNSEVFQHKMNAIEKWYNMEPYKSVWLSQELEEFYKAVNAIAFRIEGYDFLNNFENIIFEGSQGVLLDMDHGVFPYVTYANTTSKNAQEVCDKLKIDVRSVYHVTRAYHTRHGNGPFIEKEIAITNNDEETNEYNDWQLRFKVAPLDYDLLNYAIGVENVYSENCHKTLVVTCNDQVNEEFDAQKLKFRYNSLILSFSSSWNRLKYHHRVSHINDLPF